MAKQSWKPQDEYDEQDGQCVNIETMDVLVEGIEYNWTLVRVETENGLHGWGRGNGLAWIPTRWSSMPVCGEIHPGTRRWQD